jgi:uncharacterized repeat protein (TIGR03809 family)
MTTQSDGSRYQHALIQWLDLANRRLQHLTELRDNGRYRKYYDDDQFRQVLQDSRASVDTWKRLADGGWTQGQVIALRRESEALVDETVILIASPLIATAGQDKRSVA